MANPQIQNGYVKIANEIVEALIATDLAGQDFKIALFIIRKTYGFNKTEDIISLSQMMSATGMSKIRCSQVVNRLQLRKILTVTEFINGVSKKYRLNKDFESWTTIKKNINRYKKTKSTVKVLRNLPLRKSVTTKDTITKDTITKDIYGEFTKLTHIEYSKLTERYGKSVVDKYIDKLNNYIGSKGKRYKSHYHTILVWLGKDNVSPVQKKEEFINDEKLMSSEERRKMSEEFKKLTKKIGRKVI